ncbi:hypothetical protein [Nonomuraea solani]|nr:hypothetical protein [Nonomuraea solani]
MSVIATMLGYHHTTTTSTATAASLLEAAESVSATGVSVPVAKARVFGPV